MENDFSEQIKRLAQKFNIPIHFKHPSTEELMAYVNEGVEMFFVAEYPFKIPSIDMLKYGVNLHTSLLPEGRGPTPLPYLIKDIPHAAGLTLHKLSGMFDSGDIILQQPIILSSSETLNSLSIKMYLAASILVEQLLGDLSTYYERAVPQIPQQGLAVPDLTERLIEWTSSGRNIEAKIKAFGHFGVIVFFAGKYWRVTHAEVVECENGEPPGTLIYKSNDLVAITIVDGFIVIPVSAFFSIELN